MKNGVFQNEQDILNLFNHIYNKLDVKSEDIREHPIFITEPILNPYYHRKQIASALFDNLNVPALFFASQPILSLYASGSKTGVILESGDSITQCCIVYEGYTIPHSYIRYDYGGRHVTEYLQTLLKKSGYSFNSTAEFEIVKAIKETMCYTFISTTTGDESKKIAETAPTQYFLPDGNCVYLKEEKVLAPEVIFNPSIMGMEYLSFQDMIVTSLNKVDIDIRSQLYSHVLLSGGNTLFKGIERVHTEVKKLAPKHMKVKLHTPQNRKYSCWSGGSMITSLTSFRNMWVTRSEYSEKNENEIFFKTF